MGVFTFVCKLSGKKWKASCYENDEVEDLEASSQFELEQALRQVAIDNSSGGGVSCSFNWVTPKSAICQYIIGGSAVAAVGGGGAAGGGEAAAADGGAAAAPSEEEEDSDEEMGFSLFD